MTFRIFHAALLLLIVLLVPFASVSAQTDSESGRIMVSSDRLEADENARSVTFYGQVQTRKDDMVIYADRMTLFYVDGGGEKIDRIEIDGRLRIVQNDRMATADHGVYRNSEGIILLTGNAEVRQGENSIVGDEIEYFIDEARSVVKSQPDSRVNAVFSPGGK